jgi:hypothetical protein
MAKLTVPPTGADDTPEVVEYGDFMITGLSSDWAFDGANRWKEYAMYLETNFSNVMPKAIAMVNAEAYLDLGRLALAGDDTVAAFDYLEVCLNNTPTYMLSEVFGDV